MKFRARPSEGRPLVTPNCHMPGSYRELRAHAHPVPVPAPVGQVPWGAGPGTRIWGHPFPEPRSNRSAPFPGRALQIPPDPPTDVALPPTSPSPSPLARAGGLQTSLTVSAPRKQSCRRASPGTHSTARRRAATRSGAGGPAPRMNGAPLPHGGARGAAASPTSPRDGRQRGSGGKLRAPSNLPAAPSPKQRRPSNASALWGAAPSGYCSACRERAAPRPSLGDSWGPTPPETRGQAESAGVPSRRPAAPHQRSLRHPPPAPAGRAPRTHLAAGRATCGAPPRPSLPQAGRRRAGRAAAEEGPAPRSSLVPPPGRPRPAESREARALESFGAEWRPRALLRRRGGAGALAALGSRAWRVCVWGGRGGSGGGRGRDCGRDRYGH